MICPTLTRRERKGKLLKGQCRQREERKEAVLPRQLYIQRQVVEREQARHSRRQNEPEHEKEPDDQNILPKLVSSKVRSSRTIQSEAERKSFKSVSLERNLSQNN